MRISGTRLSQNYTQKLRTQNNLVRTENNRLEFQPMTKEYIPLLRKYMKYNPERTCDYTVGGMFMWTDYFDYEFCEVEDTLFIKGISENHPGLVAFSLPLGKMQVSKAVKLISEYCTHHGLKPSFSAIPEAKASELADVTGGKVEPLEGWSDYLYDINSLATLSGKVYSKKRNHVNRFIMENPDGRLEMLSHENLSEAREFMNKVCLENKEDRDMADYELSQCKDVLDNLELYGFEGAILRSQSGEVCAVTLGEVVGDTLYVHIEKMDHDTAGAGETVNKLFAAEMLDRHPELHFVNREEDMNDPGLRFAKESYHPVALLGKCNIIV